MVALGSLIIGILQAAFVDKIEACALDRHAQSAISFEDQVRLAVSVGLVLELFLAIVCLLSALTLTVLGKGEKILIVLKGLNLVVATA